MVGNPEVGQKRRYEKLGGIAVEFFLIHAANLWDTLADLWCPWDARAKSIFVQ